MKPIKDFKEFMKDGTVRKITPDLNRALFLKKESERRKIFLDELKRKIGIKDDNANYIIENSYNVLSEILRAKLLESGYSASGLGAHEAEVSFMKNLSFQDSDVIFMNDLRYFRNGILYYGKVLDKEYAERVLGFLNKIYPKLKNLLKTEKEVLEKWH